MWVVSKGNQGGVDGSGLDSEEGSESKSKSDSGSKDENDNSGAKPESNLEVDVDDVESLLSFLGLSILCELPCLPGFGRMACIHISPVSFLPLPSPPTLHSIEFIKPIVQKPNLNPSSITSPSLRCPSVAAHILHTVFQLLQVCVGSSLTPGAFERRTHVEEDQRHQRKCRLNQAAEDKL